jgi:23S rRNA (adenine2030-N6)-methyltransferase
MLSYRHAFHAGGPADCLKHGVLVFCLDYLTRKEKPFFCVDTHAGAGLYLLYEGTQNREWEQGFGRLLGEEKPLSGLLRHYLELVTDTVSRNSTTDSTDKDEKKVTDTYPGSPEIIRRMLRPHDKALCFELHPADFTALSSLMGGERRFTVRKEDGLAGLLGLLPPPSRRGLFLIDPSYEVKEDYRTLPEILGQAFRRFSTGTYIIWYPLLRDSPAPELPGELEALCGDGAGCCRAEIYTAQEDRLPENSPRGMYGSGLMIRNPPWTLKAALEESLPQLAGIFSGDWMLQWKE